MTGRIYKDGRRLESPPVRHTAPCRTRPGPLPQKQRTLPHMSMQPGGLLPGLEPQGPDTKGLLVTVTLVTVMWAGFQLLGPKSPPPSEAPAAPAAPAPVAVAPAELSAPAGTPNALPEEKRTFTADVAAAMAAAGV